MSERVIIYASDPAFHGPSYEQGYRDGESSAWADYQAALDEIPGFDWPEDRGFSPSDVAEVIRLLASR